MNSGSLGNRSLRQPKQSSNVDQSSLTRRPRIKNAPQADASGLNQCSNGVCQISWKPGQIESKLSENLGS